MHKFRKTESWICENESTVRDGSYPRRTGAQEMDQNKIYPSA